MAWVAAAIARREKHGNPHLWHDTWSFRRPLAASLIASPGAAAAVWMHLRQRRVGARFGDLSDGSSAQCWRERS